MRVRESRSASSAPSLPVPCQEGAGGRRGASCGLWSSASNSLSVLALVAVRADEVYLTGSSPGRMHAIKRPHTLAHTWVVVGSTAMQLAAPSTRNLARAAPANDVLWPCASAFWKAIRRLAGLQQPDARQHHRARETSQRQAERGDSTRPPPARHPSLLTRPVPAPLPYAEYARGPARVPLACSISARRNYRSLVTGKDRVPAWLRTHRSVYQTPSHPDESHRVHGRFIFAIVQVDASNDCTCPVLLTHVLVQVQHTRACQADFNMLVLVTTITSSVQGTGYQVQDTWCRV